MASRASQPRKKRAETEATLPVEVTILTRDHEIQGIVHVSRETHEDRRISDLINNAERRFLAVTDARLLNRTGPSLPRMYSFLQLHIDNIILIHPTTQSVMRNTEYSREEATRFEGFREKLNKAEVP